jgi:aryl-alcohol dehydrogenase-like predicted oxidoreductase
MTAMRYRLLGHSGLRVSELCLGTMTFGEEWGWGSDEKSSRAVYDAFREAGGNFVDTANMYTNGSSERFLGNFLREGRDSVVLATKFTNVAPGTNKGRDPNLGGTGRKTMVQAVEASLKRLGTDRIDLYWVHAWDFMTPVDELMRGLDDLVRAGKVLYVGISDAPAWAVAQANTMAAMRGWSPFIGLQIEYSLIERTVERELIPMAHAFNLGVLAWSPLAGGVLTGKYAKPGADAGRIQKADLKSRLNPRSVAIAAEVVAIAADLECEPGQVALAWLRVRGAIPILGARTVEQLHSNLGCLEVALTVEQCARLETVSKIDLGFPHEFLIGARHYTFGDMFDDIARKIEVGSAA